MLKVFINNTLRLGLTGLWSLYVQVLLFRDIAQVTEQPE
jgi:hypothetical protein